MQQAKPQAMSEKRTEYDVYYYGWRGKKNIVMIFGELQRKRQKERGRERERSEGKVKKGLFCI